MLTKKELALRLDNAIGTYNACYVDQIKQERFEKIKARFKSYTNLNFKDEYIEQLKKENKTLVYFLCEVLEFSGPRYVDGQMFLWDMDKRVLDELLES